MVSAESTMRMLCLGHPIDWVLGARVYKMVEPPHELLVYVMKAEGVARAALPTKLKINRLHDKPSCNQASCDKSILHHLLGPVVPVQVTQKIAFRYVWILRRRLLEHVATKQSGSHICLETSCVGTCMYSSNEMLRLTEPEKRV